MIFGLLWLKQVYGVSEEKEDAPKTHQTPKLLNSLDITLWIEQVYGVS